METLVGLNCSTVECSSPSPTAPIWQDVLAQAMTGELIAAMNYTSLSEVCDDPNEVAEALEHSQIERGHAARFAAEGRKIGHVHLRHLNPLPSNLGEVIQRYKKVLVPELNMGQLLWVLRARYLVDAVGLNKIQGRPFKQSEVEQKIEEMLDI